MRKLYRIAREEHARTPEIALSGVGGLRAPGRWQDQAVPLIYAASSRSLALIEIMVHLDTADPASLADRRWIEITIPDGVAWEAVNAELMDGFDPAWTNPDAKSCKSFGGDWIRSRSTALLQVPSAIIPEETNWLINPAHQDFEAILEATRIDWATRPVRWDARVTAMVAALSERRARGPA